MIAADIPTGPGAGFSVLVIVLGLILGLGAFAVIEFMSARDTLRGGRQLADRLAAERKRQQERGHD